MGGNILLSILPPKFKSKSGAKEPKNRQNLSFERDLLEKHFIACGSIFPEIESIYRWEGRVEEGREAKVILKTVPHHFDAIRTFILSQCSYEVPEIVQIDITDGHLPYLSWVIKETFSQELSEN